MFDVHEVDYEHIDKFIEILVERCIWLSSKNLGMWDINQLNKKAIIEKYEIPRCFIGCVDEVKIGGFLLIEQDKRYWPDKLSEKAYYFHKFVVKPGYGGNGYSDKMIEWTKDLCIADNKEYMRLDYEKHRSYLRNMYLKHGFEDIEVQIHNDGKEVVKAEWRNSKFVQEKVE